MDATQKSGVTRGSEEFFGILLKGNKSLGLVGEPSRAGLLDALAPSEKPRPRHPERLPGRRTKGPKRNKE